METIKSSNAYDSYTEFVYIPSFLVAWNFVIDSQETMKILQLYKQKAYCELTVTSGMFRLHVRAMKFVTAAADVRIAILR